MLNSAIQCTHTHTVRTILWTRLEFNILLCFKCLAFISDVLRQEIEYSIIWQRMAVVCSAVMEVSEVLTDAKLTQPFARDYKTNIFDRFIM